MSHIGNRMRSLREQKKITQAELGAKIGVSGATVNRYEQGKREPDIDTLEKIADFFDVTLDYLTGRTDIPGYPTHLKDLPPMERLAAFVKENDFKDLYFSRSGSYFDDLTSDEVDELIMSLLEVRKERLRMEAEKRRKSEEQERK